MRSNKLLFFTQTAFFGVIATAVKLFSFPIFFVPGFYKLDFCESIVLIGGFMLGPSAGIMIELMKTILFFLFKGTSSFLVGEIAGFIIGCSFILPSCIIYKKNRTLEGAVHGMILGIISLVMISSIFNYFVFLPIYSNFFGIPSQKIINAFHVINPNIHNLFSFILFAVIPFNLLKGSLSCFVSIALYKKMSRFIEKITIKAIYKNSV